MDIPQACRRSSGSATFGPERGPAPASPKPGLRPLKATGTPATRKCGWKKLPMKMRVATWNVNSIKQRVDPLVAWLKEREPDVACLQEIKCVDEAFPREPFEALGYNVAVHGQKTFNGVAVLSKLRFDEVTPRLPGEADDDHARFLEVAVSTPRGALRIASIYLPNGNPPQTDKYPYKLRWMDRLMSYAQERLRLEEP